MKKSLRFFRQVFSLGVLATLLQITTLAQVTNGTVVITRPSDGASFALGEPILITADAYDAQGYMPRVEFYETNVLIGVSTLNFLPAPAITPVQHSMIWSNALPGIHTVRALGIGSSGNKTYSDPVHIRVLPKTNQTVVRIVATDPEATKFSGPIGAFDSATFTVFRDGPTNNPLVVFMSFHGTAQMGVDYQVYPMTNSTAAFMPITIPAGQYSMNVPIVPVSAVVPSTNHWIQTVGIHLEYSPLAGPLASYAIDPQYREDAAVIYNQTRPTEGALEIAIPSEGERFSIGQDIDLLAAGVHPIYPIENVDFFVDGFKIKAPEDTSDIEKPVHTPAITWNNPPAGLHRVYAQTTLPNGKILRSSTIHFSVGDEPAPPTVSIHFLPDMTDRPIPNADYAPGSVRIDRTGPTNNFLEVRLRIGGTAIPGLDYQEIPWSITIPPGQSSAFITVDAIDDNIAETNETVVISIDSPLLPIPGETLAYYIDPAASEAVVTIYDNDSSNQYPPAVRISSPRDGSTFHARDPINIFAEAQSSNSVIQFIEVRVDGLQLARTNGGYIGTIWKTPTPGTHFLTAFALDATGLASTSAPVRINISGISHPAAIRNLPEQYIPGRPISVSISINPGGVSTYAVEDRPPTNWVVTAVSHEGVFDPITRKVKFGPYFDGTNRFLTYTVTPPTNAFGIQTFEGHADIGGVLYTIGGDTHTAFTPRFHPADINTNSAITLQEVTGYAYAWKRGALWPIPPNPIPVDYVTRAALIWRRGEAYRFDPNRGPAPLCWIPKFETNVLKVAALIGSAERLGENPSPGSSSTIKLAVTPSADTASYAVVEKLPPGLEVSDISDEGEPDLEAGLIRWGPFFDATPRTLSYGVTAPARVASSALLEGFVSFDGQSQAITGKTLLVASDTSTQVTIQNSELSVDGSLHLTVSGAPGQFLTVESSKDLLHWNAVGTEFLQDGSAEVIQPAATEHLFYRLRIN